MINPGHLAMLAASGITPDHAALRGYETIDRQAPAGRAEDRQGCPQPRPRPAGADAALRRLAPGATSTGPTIRGCATASSIKYETPWRQRNGLDFPPGVAPMLGDPAIPLWITEGVKKADCGALHGLCIVGLVRVWNWLGTNTAGGKMALADWRDIALNGRRVIIAFDGDMARKPSVQKAVHALAAYLAVKGARVEYLWLPDTDDKTGLDDYLWPGTPSRSCGAWSSRTSRRSAASSPTATARRAETRATGEPVADSLDRGAHGVPPLARRGLRHRRAGRRCWPPLAVEKFDDGCDPLWLLIISGSGNAKTETVQALDGVGAIVTSSITGEAALLSATPKRERAKDATGGLLRKIGDRGVLVIKDVTSILSMNSDARAKVLAALREIYDGRWYREVGAEGGRTLEWRGRLVVVGAVTTAWDTDHASSPPWATGSSSSASTPPRPGWRPGGRPSPTPATRWRCAPSWPPRWPASSPG